MDTDSARHELQDNGNRVPLDGNVANTTSVPIHSATTSSRSKPQDESPHDDPETHPPVASPPPSLSSLPQQQQQQQQPTAVSYFRLLRIRTNLSSWWTTSTRPYVNGNDTHMEDDRDDHTLHHPLLQRGRDDGDDDDDDDDRTVESVSSTYFTRCVHSWNVRLQERHHLFLLIWILVIWPLGGWIAFSKFQQETDSTVHPIPGSLSQVAQEAFHRAYHHPQQHCYGHNDTNHTNATTATTTSAADWSNPLNPPLIIVLESTNPSKINDTNASFFQHNHSQSPLSFDEKWSLIDPMSPAYSSARNFTKQLTNHLQQHCWGLNNDDDNQNGCPIDQANASSSSSWFRLTSYYSLVDQGLPSLATALAADDGTTVLIQINYLSPSSVLQNNNNVSSSSSLFQDKVSDTTSQQRQERLGSNSRRDREMVYELMDEIEQFSQSYSESESYFAIHYTGLMWFQTDLSQAMHEDLRRMDYIVVPLALILIGFVFRSVANPFVVWIIPLISMVSTVSCWSIVMWFVATRRNVQITQFTPTIMMSLTVGMGIDYTLFLLARYLEDGKKERQVDAIERMIGQGGHVLLLSGLTLMCTFLGLCFLPLQALKSVGIGAAVTIASTLFVNLTVVPALLYTRLGEWILKPKVDDGSPVVNNDLGTLDEPPPPAPLHPPPSLWYRLSKQLLHPYRGIIILLLTIQVLMSVSQYAAQVRSSLSFDLMLPWSSPALQTFHSLGRTFGWGRLNTYRILFDGSEANMTMTSSAGFSAMQVVVDELMAIDEIIGDVSLCSTDPAIVEGDISMSAAKQLDAKLKPYNSGCQVWDARGGECETNSSQMVQKRKGTSYTGISIINNLRVPHSLFLMAKYCAQAKPFCPFEGLRTIEAVDELATSDDRYATFITVSLGVNPFSDEGIVWLESARATTRLLEDSGKLLGVKVYIEGVAAIEYDSYNAVHTAFPSMIMITTIVVFILMGAFFRSVFLPFRSIVSIGFTLSFSFGLGVLVYQDGVFDWTGIQALTPIGNEFCWLVPIMAFSVIVGLALDYDVFLVSRILEYRLDGYEHKTSIATALNATGGIITAAGLIMAFAFGSLMFSSSPVLCQWSFVTTVAVLLDTFVIRSIVVPAITGLAGPKSWWPRVVPQATITMPEFDGGFDAVSSLLRSLEASSEYEPLTSETPRTP